MPSSNRFGVTDAVLTRAQEVGDDLRARTGVAVDACELVLGRAVLLGLTPNGRTSAGGATRLFRTADTWCALTLSRPDDVAAVPALLGTDVCDDDPWPEIKRWANGRTAAEVVDRAVLLDLPVAELGETAAAPPRVIGCGTAGPARGPAGLLVVDLTSMWAGPLCGQLLARAGAIVVKVESPARPDGTRSGQRTFFDWMNTGKSCYSVDFDRHREHLERLLGAADVVLEGSRPAALARRGLGPHDCPPVPGRVWLRVTGHGTDDDNAARVAFGDDAAVAGGLVGHDGETPVFMGDAIADPLAGLAATVAVVDSLERGGGLLVEVSMAAVAATYAALSAGPVASNAVSSPSPAPAGELGADNAVVEQLVVERLGPPC